MKGRPMTAPLDGRVAFVIFDVVSSLAGDGSATISGSQIAVDRGTAKY
jgi:hypothetical protein